MEGGVRCHFLSGTILFIGGLVPEDGRGGGGPRGFGPGVMALPLHNVSATEVGGTHPTGMPSCYVIHCLNLFTDSPIIVDLLHNESFLLSSIKVCCLRSLDKG